MTRPAGVFPPLRGPAMRASGRGVAQSGSAPVLGTGGREFESRRPDQAIVSAKPKSIAPSTVTTYRHRTGDVGRRGTVAPVEDAARFGQAEINRPLHCHDISTSHRRCRATRYGRTRGRCGSFRPSRNQSPPPHATHTDIAPRHVGLCDPAAPAGHPACFGQAELNRSLSAAGAHRAAEYPPTRAGPIPLQAPTCGVRRAVTPLPRVGRPGEEPVEKPV